MLRRQQLIPSLLSYEWLDLLHSVIRCPTVGITVLLLLSLYVPSSDHHPKINRIADQKIEFVPLFMTQLRRYDGHHWFTFLEKKPQLRFSPCACTGLDDLEASGDGTGMKRPYPMDGIGGDSDTDDPKRLCIDEEGGNLQCPRCSYVAKWKSDLERHMKVSHVCNQILLYLEFFSKPFHSYRITIICLDFL